jgi:hypothetical protein
VVIIYDERPVLFWRIRRGSQHLFVRLGIFPKIILRRKSERRKTSCKSGGDLFLFIGSGEPSPTDGEIRFFFFFYFAFVC